jgi:iron complex outermembrane receptor protein
MFPALANKGGLTFWAAFTGVYNSSIYGNLQTAATNFVLSDPASLAAIAAAVPGLVASGLTLAQAQAAATGQLVLANFSNPALRAAAVQGTMAQTAGTVQFLESAGIATFKPAFGDWQKNFESDQEIKNVEEAIFAEVDYDLSDKWQVRLGVRWMDTRKDSLARSGVLDINQFQTAYYATEAEANATLPRNRANFETVTGRVIFDYQLSEDTLLYFGYNKGTKPGGYEPAVDTQAAAQLGDILVDTEEHDIFEIGTKGSYFGGALILNLNAYQNTITGNQLQRLVGLATSTYNGDTENTGFEVEAFAFLSESTRIDASISGNDHVYTNATGVDPNNPYGATQMLPLGADGTLIQSFNGAAFASLGIPGFGQNYLNLNHDGLAQAFGANAGAIYAITTYGMTDVGPIFTQFGLLCNQPFALVCPDPGIDQDLNGNKVQYVPELAYKFGLEQDVMNNAAGTMTLRFEHTYVGERFVTEFNTMELPSYQFSNLSLRYVHSSDRFGFNLKVYNLLDEDLIIGGAKGSNANAGVITYYQLRPTATNLQFFVRY